MDKTTQLIIRACKANDPNRRLRTLYRRFYGRVPRGEESQYIAGILSKICDDYAPLRTASMINDLNPMNRWKFGIEDDETYLDGVVKILASHIRLTERDRFVGLETPTRFKNTTPKAA